MVIYRTKLLWTVNGRLAGLVATADRLWVIRDVPAAIQSCFSKLFIVEVQHVTNSMINIFSSFLFMGAICTINACTKDSRELSAGRLF